MTFEERVLQAPKHPDFNRLLQVLRRQVPDRPTLFEFFMNDPIYAKLAGEPVPVDEGPLALARHTAAAFYHAGYDYATFPWNLLGFGFVAGARPMDHVVSLNECPLIHDRASFESYRWPDPDAVDYSIIADAGDALPAGMKWIAWGAGGVLETVIALVGYQNLCFMIADEPKLAQAIFDAVGSRLVGFFGRCAQFDGVGAILAHDDWGFKTQTMLSPADMRRFVFPWHQRIVAAAHAAGKPAILHSCSNLRDVMDDIIDRLHFDAKHSFEDAICPVEAAYERWGGRIAILGGIDLDFICRARPQQVYDRARRMLDRARDRGGYALGTGNSVPAYVPQENYFALLAAAVC